jgi:YfiH family protein
VFHWRAELPGGGGAAFTDRFGGFSKGPLAQLNLGRTDEDELSALRSNIAAVQAAIGVDRVAAVHQVHSAAVVTVDEAFLSGWGTDSWLGDKIPGQPPLLHADALVSDQPSVALAIRVADCMPVLFADRNSAVIGAAHAGRAGLLAGVLENTVAAMIRLGSDPNDLTAWIGPHICGSCYEVPQQMLDRVRLDNPEMAAHTSWGTPSLDLGAGAQARLERLGVAVQQVGECTYESSALFSHRADGPQAGRQAGLIWR